MCQLPWSEILPVSTMEYLRCAASSVASLPEYVLFTLLGAIATVIGSRTEIRMGKDTDWKVSPSLYIVAAGPPGTSKTSVIKTFLEYPLMFVSEENNVELLINEYTKSGLHQHLHDHQGEGCIYSDEIHMTLKTALIRDKDGNGERAVFNKLWSNSSWMSHFSASKKRCVELSNLVICGLTQYDSWVNIHNEMNSTGDGLLDRVVQLMVKPHWCVSSEREPAKDRLKDEYKNVSIQNMLNTLYKEHHIEDIAVKYTISEDGMGFLNNLNDSIMQELNAKVLDGNYDFSCAQSKFADNVAKLAVPLHNFVKYVEDTISGNATQSTHTITKGDIMRSAALLKVCREQSRDISNAMDGIDVDLSHQGPSIGETVLRCPGPFIPVRDIMRRVGKKRAPTSECITQELLEMETNGLGHVVTIKASKIFVKAVPVEETEKERYDEMASSLLRYRINPKDYLISFGKRSDVITQTMHKLIINKVHMDRIRNFYSHTI